MKRLKQWNDCQVEVSFNGEDYFMAVRKDGKLLFDTCMDYDAFKDCQLFKEILTHK